MLVHRTETVYCRKNYDSNGYLGQTVVLCEPVMSAASLPNPQSHTHPCRNTRGLKLALAGVYDADDVDVCVHFFCLGHTCLHRDYKLHLKQHRFLNRCYSAKLLSDRYRFDWISFIGIGQPALDLPV